MGKGTVEKVMH